MRHTPAKFIAVALVAAALAATGCADDEVEVDRYSYTTVSPMPYSSTYGVAGPYEMRGDRPLRQLDRPPAQPLVIERTTITPQPNSTAIIEVERTPVVPAPAGGGPALAPPVAVPPVPPAARVTPESPLPAPGAPVDQSPPLVTPPADAPPSPPPAVLPRTVPPPAPPPAPAPAPAPNLPPPAEPEPEAADR